MAKGKKLMKRKNAKEIVAVKKELSDLEKRALATFEKKKAERGKPPEFKTAENGTVMPVDSDFIKFLPKLMGTTGSSDIYLFETIMNQVSATLSLNEREKAFNFIASFMHGLKPGDETEGILISQMAGAHNLIMEFMKQAVTPGQFPAVTNDYTLRACKLMHVFLKQLEVLEKYRGKSSHQKVIVEHVHIHQGGQAVVGHIENRPRGEGDEKKK